MPIMLEAGCDAIDAVLLPGNVLYFHQASVNRAQQCLGKDRLPRGAGHGSVGARVSVRSLGESGFARSVRYALRGHVE